MNSDVSHSTGQSRTAYGWGVATIAADGSVLDTLFLDFGLGEGDAQPAAEVAAALDSLASAAGDDRSLQLREVTRQRVHTQISLDAAPADVSDAYLRLHLLSARHIQPHGCNLDGVFGVLNNVVWTNHGPCAVSTFSRVRGQLAAALGQVTVYSVDKFPRMVDYVVPEGVRIGDADRVRLGAHLASGTTVMHEGFVNFNAGTLGHSMVEGRISGGVVVDDGSDVGGGASIMGTLSGGGKEVIRVGKRCLLGANSGVGISLGDDVTVEAGLYVTYGMKVLVRGEVAQRLGKNDGDAVKASELSGASGMVLRRNSATGAVEAIPAVNQVDLNAELHAN